MTCRWCGRSDAIEVVDRAGVDACRFTGHLTGAGATARLSVFGAEVSRRLLRNRTSTTGSASLSEVAGRVCREPTRRAQRRVKR